MQLSANRHCRRTTPHQQCRDLCWQPLPNPPIHGLKPRCLWWHRTLITNYKHQVVIKTLHLDFHCSPAHVILITGGPIATCNRLETKRTRKALHYLPISFPSPIPSAFFLLNKPSPCNIQPILHTHPGFVPKDPLSLVTFDGAMMGSVINCLPSQVWLLPLP